MAVHRGDQSGWARTVPDLPAPLSGGMCAVTGGSGLSQLRGP